MSNCLPPFFNAVFNDETATPLAPASGGKLYTYISGTTTPQTTYQDSTTGSANTNPIILDTQGRCNLWLIPTDVYTFKLTRSDDTLIKTWDNVAGSALATGVVTSVNGDTGAVSLDASDIPFTTGTSTTWFAGTDVGAALDAVITRVDGGITAAAVTIADTGGYFTGTNVETALQELGARSSHGALLRISVFTANGTWTKASDVGMVMVKGVGGGGGSTANLVGGGGGGAGGYFEKLISAPSSTVTVTIGAGGVPGSNGAATSFGAYASATGGAFGAAVAGGVGGVGSGGDINLVGGGGQWGGNITNNFYGGGGNSVFGGGAIGNENNTTGANGSANTGGGGSGGTSTGGTGGSGLVLVYEYS